MSEIDTNDFLKELNNIADECKSNEDDKSRKVCTEYGEKLDALVKEYYDQYGISTLVCWGDPALLDHAFIGGCLVRHQGSTYQEFQILYQLLFAMYMKLKENSNKAFALSIFDGLMNCLRNEDEIYLLKEDEDIIALKKLLKGLLAKMNEMDDSDDD